MVPTIVPNVHVKPPVVNVAAIAPLTTGIVIVWAGEVPGQAGARSPVQPLIGAAPKVTLVSALTIEPGRFVRLIPASETPAEPLMNGRACALPADKPSATIPVATTDLRVLFIWFPRSVVSIKLIDARS